MLSQNIFILVFLNSTIFAYFKLLEFTDRFNKEEIHIVFVGDYGKSISKSKIKKNVVKQIKKINKNRPFDMGVILGDNVYPTGCTRDQFESIDDTFLESFDEKNMNIRFLTLIGNHDYFGDIETQFNYYTHHPRYFLPHRYYKFNVELKDDTKISFIVADSNPILEEWMIKAYGIEDAVQKKFIIESLKKEKDSPYLFLLAHHNIISSFGPHSEIPEDNFFSLASNQYNVSAIFTGHNHNQQFIPKNDKRYFDHFIVGNSAKKSKISSKNAYPDGWYKDDSGGFGILKISKRKSKFTFFDSDGKQLKSVDIYPKK